jgi:hypothetical protein
VASDLLVRATLQLDTEPVGCTNAFMQLFGTHESAEQVAPVDSCRRILATKGRFDSWIRRLQPERPVWAMGVVVLDVDPQHLLEVAPADNQQPVQSLGADRPDPAFGVGVGVGRLDRRDQHLSALRLEHVVEGAGELGVAVAEQESRMRSLCWH